MPTCPKNPHIPIDGGVRIVTNFPSYHKFRTQNCFYFYDFNTNGIVRISKDIYENMDYCLDGIGKHSERQTGKGEVLESVRNSIEDMKKKGLLHRTPNEKISPPICDKCADKKYESIEMMCLELSQQCNLRCKYCAYSGIYKGMRTHTQRLTKFEVARKAIDYYLQHSKEVDKPVISFYGGEPLLNKKVMIECCRYARSHGAATPNLRFTVDTNGTLVDKELLDFFMEEDFIVQISLDGPKHVHDKNRMFPNGDGSWRKVDSLLRAIYSRSPRFYEENVFIACTMAPPYPVWDLDRYFSGDKEKRFNMMVNFVDEEGVDLESLYSDEFAKGDVWQGLRRYYNHYLTKMCTGKREELSNVARVLYDRAIIDVLTKPRDPYNGRLTCNGICIPGTRKLFVDVDGYYYPCERVGQDFKIGRVDIGFDLDAIDQLVADYKELCEKYCHKCWAARLCRLCFAAARRDGGLSEERKLEECEYERSNLHNTLVSIAYIMETNPESLEWIKDVVIT